VADICRAAGREVRGFLDRQGAHGDPERLAGVLGGDELLDDRAFVVSHEFVVGVGHQRTRRRLAELVRAKGGILTSVIHPSAVVAPDVRIGAGVVVVAGCVVNPGAVLGDLVIVNTGATVDHDCLLSEGVHVCPGAHLTGSVTCREYACVGAGAVVIPGRTIGARAMVGAGAVVIADVGDDVTVAGCPARVIKNVGC
jgi:sugar O-acyltransferase (sialic acid O-acetyltransferase NeuD family)